MRRLHYLLGFTFTLLLVSCDTEDELQCTSLNEILVGTWGVESKVDNQISADIFHFHEDGTFIADRLEVIPDFESARYEVIDNSQYNVYTTDVLNQTDTIPFYISAFDCSEMTYKGNRLEIKYIKKQ